MKKANKVLLAGIMTLGMALSAGTVLGATVVKKAAVKYPVITKVNGTYTITNVNKVTKVTGLEKITVKTSATAAAYTLTDLVPITTTLQALGGTATVSSTNVATIKFDGSTSTLALNYRTNAQKIGTVYYVKASVLAPKLVTVYAKSSTPVAVDTVKNTFTRSKIAQIGLQWSGSVHNNANWEPVLFDEAKSTSCGKCHNGYVAQNYDNLETVSGKLTWKAGTPNAGQTIELDPAVAGAVDSNYTCGVCHSGRIGNAKTTGKTPVLSNGLIVRGGAGAACMTCHEGRNKVAKYDVVAKSNAAPHHSNQTDLLMGTVGYKYAGTANAVNSLGSYHGSTPNACVGCHMSDKVNGVANHTMNINGAVACGLCHTGLTSADRLAFGDYDGNKTIDNYTEEVKGLTLVIRQAIADKIKAEKSLTTDPSFLSTSGQIKFFKVPTAGLTAEQITALVNSADDVTYDLGPDAAKIYNAAYNVLNIEYDGSNGLHNPAYTIKLLQASYKDLTGNAVPNAQLR